MELRAFREENFETIYALDRACFGPRFRFSRATMRRVVGAAGTVVLTAFEAGQLVGFCATEVEQDAEQRWGYVATLDVSPASRERGVGSALMRGVEEAARRAGAAVMLLHVFVENAAAVGLYERLGYARVARETGFYGPGFDAWLYRKLLERA